VTEIGWKFPSNGGGQIEGFNNASIDTFIGNRVFSLVREAIQNSLDARLDKNKPVLVSFSLDELEASKVPEVTALAEFLKLASAREKTNTGNAQSLHFYENALARAKSKKTALLGIHDSNTTGLEGPTVDAAESKPGSWLGLVKGAGLTVHKASDAAGSFGHGSKAPIGVSQLRSVFYYTKILNDKKTEERRFQGKSILQSMPLNGETTQGTGYYGVQEKLMPLVNAAIPTWANEIRESNAPGIGTSIYVPFPNLATEGEDFWLQVQLSVLTNFYHAISSGVLNVRLGGLETIEAANVERIFDQVMGSLIDFDQSFLERIDGQIASAVTMRAKDSDIKGKLSVEGFEAEWFIRLGDSVGKKAVGISRNGMLITRQAKNLKQFVGTRPFDMVVSVLPGDGSALLRKLENPEHNDFQFDRIDDLSERREFERKYDRFTAEIKNIINQHASVNSESEMFVSDLDDLFGGGVAAFDSGNQGETSVELVIGKPRKQKMRQGEPTAVIDESEDGDTGGTSGGETEHKGKGGDIPREDGTDSGPGIALTGRQVKNLRMVRQEGNQVKVHFTPVVKGKFDLILYRSGDSDREAIEVKTPNNGWVKKIPLDAGRRPMRKVLLIELAPEDFGYAYEAVMVSEQ
jgi:hypothetical protein